MECQACSQPRTPSRTARRRAAQAFAAIALASISGCASTYEFEVPEGHPALASNTTGGALHAPSPFDLAPPLLGSSGESSEHSTMPGDGMEPAGTMESHEDDPAAPRAAEPRHEGARHEHGGHP